VEEIIRQLVLTDCQCAGGAVSRGIHTPTPLGKLARIHITVNEIQN
jgi:hypothetical protein